MPSMRTRRQFLEAASAVGATLALGTARVCTERAPWTERREFYPAGRRLGRSRARQRHSLDATAAEAQRFARLTRYSWKSPAIGTSRRSRRASSSRSPQRRTGPAASSPPGLKPATEYWYRFTDDDGNGSRVGRTLTAPRERDARPVRFTFVSCQDMTIGAANAYRRMIYEDERRPRAEQLGFVLHLGDFIYEVVNYADEMPEGKYRGRRLRPLFKYPNGDKFRDFHLPATLADYRTVYRAYLTDPDLQDARARWPFVPVWDNHEFSWQGYQSIQVFGGEQRPAQTLKVAANQAWWEYQPARVAQPGANRDRFEAPAVKDTPITKYDEHGFGRGADNVAAVESLHYLPRVPLRPQRRADPHRQPLVQDRRRGRLRGVAGRIPDVHRRRYRANHRRRPHRERRQTARDTEVRGQGRSERGRRCSRCRPIWGRSSARGSSSA